MQTGPATKTHLHFLHVFGLLAAQLLLCSLVVRPQLCQAGTQLLHLGGQLCMLHVVICSIVRPLLDCLQC